MNETEVMSGRRLVALDALLEGGTGLALMVVPQLVISLLLGERPTGAAVGVGRVAGIALLGLAVACWPGRKTAEPSPAALRGLLVYNVLVALYLAYLGVFRHTGGLLLWPAVALHVIVAVLLAFVWRRSNRTAGS